MLDVLTMQINKIPMPSAKFLHTKCKCLQNYCNNCLIIKLFKENCLKNNKNLHSDETVLSSEAILHVLSSISLQNIQKNK